MDVVASLHICLLAGFKLSCLFLVRVACNTGAGIIHYYDSKGLGVGASPFCTPDGEYDVHAQT